MIMGERRKTGIEFVEGVLGLAYGLMQMGLKPGDVVAISALNRYLSAAISIPAANGHFDGSSYK